MNRNISYVSEEWLRTFVYERGKESTDEDRSRWHRSLRLAEARAALRDSRDHWPGGSLNLED